jgi:hypothetical protein
VLGRGATGFGWHGRAVRCRHEAGWGGGRRGRLPTSLLSCTTSPPHDLGRTTTAPQSRATTIVPPGTEEQRAHPPLAPHPSTMSLTLVRHSEMLDLQVSLKIASLEGPLVSLSTPVSLSTLLANPSLKHAGSQQPLASSLYVSISLWADNKPLLPSVRTAHKSFKSKSNYAWNESFTLPIKYRDLPLSSQLAITVYDIAGPQSVAVVGGATMRLFGKKDTLKKGKQRLFLWRGVEADGSTESETPSKVGLKDEMGRLEKLVKKHERGDVTRMDWLDKLAFRQIEKIHAVSSEVWDKRMQLMIRAG